MGMNSKLPQSNCGTCSVNFSCNLCTLFSFLTDVILSSGLHTTKLALLLCFLPNVADSAPASIKDNCFLPESLFNVGLPCWPFVKGEPQALYPVNEHQRNAHHGELTSRFFLYFYVNKTNSIFRGLTERPQSSIHFTSRFR